MPRLDGGDRLDVLHETAADYRAACEEANERLRRCEGLLRRGLRSEAIQQAETEPVLLDVVAQLDFSERPTWCNLLAQHGIAPPPALALDLAGELNEAYAVERPLAGLLDQHRLLALARCPLRSRIQVLRQLSELDAQNPVWREDLTAYERERQRQLHKEVTAASEAGNLALLTTLDEELRGDPWLEAPPQGLLSRAADARARVVRQTARGELDQLAGALDAAHRRSDLAEARKLRRRWQSSAQAAQLRRRRPGPAVGPDVRLDRPARSAGSDRRSPAASDRRSGSGTAARRSAGPIGAALPPGNVRRPAAAP